MNNESLTQAMSRAMPELPKRLEVGCFDDDQMRDMAREAMKRLASELLGACENTVAVNPEPQLIAGALDVGGGSERETIIHPGHIDMTKLAHLLLQADKMPKNENGMVISARGALTIAARALNEMAVEPDVEDDPLEAHQARLDEVQPRMSAYSLETMAKHLGVLKDAVAAGDAAMVGKFFNLYVFD